MKTLIVKLELNAAFYQEHAETMTDLQLMRELRAELADQVAELKISRLLKRLKSVQARQEQYN